MADWLGIDSSYMDSFCGQHIAKLLREALDGTDEWAHPATEVHWFILDLGETYTIEKVRGRSETPADPVEVNIFVSNDKDDWGAAVATGINTWQDTAVWQEVNVTTKNGRYVKVEIAVTEHVSNHIEFGTEPHLKIFDVYGGPPAAGGRSHRCGVRRIQGAERLRGLRSNAPY